MGFESDATNLVPADTNACFDVFLHDRDADEDGIVDEAGAISTVRVSVATNGAQADGPSYDAAISGDGRFIAFTSSAGNLVTGLTRRQFSQIYLHDRITHETQLISRSDIGEPAAGYCLGPRLNADGSRLAFYGGISNIAPVSGSGTSDIFIWDRNQPPPGLSRLLTAPTGRPTELGATDPALPASGPLVAFASLSRDLGPDGAPDRRDVFLFDPAPCSSELVVTSQPSGLTTCQDQNLNVVFAVTVSGEPPIQYQWRRNGSPIPNATSSQYTIPFTSAATAGTYSVSIAHPLRRSDERCSDTQFDPPARGHDSTGADHHLHWHLRHFPGLRLGGAGRSAHLSMAL